MEELYVEGVATRDDPEPCVGVREGTGEASGWARAGRAIEPRNHRVRGADAFRSAEGNTGGGVIASCRQAPRGQRTRACVESPCARTGRSRVPPVRVITGRAAQGTLRRYA